MRMMIEDFGARIASVWEGLSSTTRKLIVGALQTPAAPSHGVARNYDARSDWELSRLLSALDERVAENSKTLSAEQAREMRHMAETCARLLQNQIGRASCRERVLPTV